MKPGDIVHATDETSYRLLEPYESKEQFMKEKPKRAFVLNVVYPAWLILETGHLERWIEKRMLWKVEEIY